MSCFICADICARGGTLAHVVSTFSVIAAEFPIVLVGEQIPAEYLRLALASHGAVLVRGGSGSGGLCGWSLIRGRLCQRLVMAPA
jgi:hypothetical protein